MSFGGFDADPLANVSATVRIDTSTLESDLDRLKQTMQATSDQADNLTTAADRTAGALDRKATAARKAGDAVEVVGKASGNSGRAVLYLAQTLDDAKQFAFGFDQGMRAIGNNVPGVAMALGAGAGLAGVVSLVVSALGVAAPRIVDFIASLSPGEVGVFTDRVGELQAKLKELEHGPRSLAVEAAIRRTKLELAEATKAADALSVALRRQTTHEAESGKQVAEAITETPGGREALEAAGQVAGAKEVAGSPTVQAAKRGVAEAERARKEAEERVRMGIEGAADALPIAVELVEDAQRRLTAAQRKAFHDGQAKLAEAYKQATQGVGREQAEGQRQIAEALTGTGLTGAGIAVEIDEAAPEQVRTRAERAEAARLAKQAAAEARRAEADQIRRDNQAEAGSIEDAQRRAHLIGQEQQQQHHKAETAAENARRRRGREAGQEIAHTAQTFGQPIMPEVESYLLGQRARREQAAQLPPAQRRRLGPIPTEEQAQQYAVNQVATGLQRAGAPGTRNDPVYAQALATDIVKKASERAGARVNEGLAMNLNLVQAIQASQMQLADQMGRHISQMQRMWSNQQMVNNRLRNNRATQLRIAR